MFVSCKGPVSLPEDPPSANPVEVMVTLAGSGDESSPVKLRIFILRNVARSCTVNQASSYKEKLL